jgi:hypothetical protein
MLLECYQWPQGNFHYYSTFVWVEQAVYFHSNELSKLRAGARVLLLDSQRSSPEFVRFNEVQSLGDFFSSSISISPAMG